MRAVLIIVLLLGIGGGYLAYRIHIALHPPAPSNRALPIIYQQEYPLNCGVLVACLEQPDSDRYPYYTPFIDIVPVTWIVVPDSSPSLRSAFEHSTIDACVQDIPYNEKLLIKSDETHYVLVIAKPHKSVVGPGWIDDSGTPAVLSIAEAGTMAADEILRRFENPIK